MISCFSVFRHDHAASLHVHVYAKKDHHTSSQVWALSGVCCWSGLWLGRLSFLSTFLKLVCYAHVFPCSICIECRGFESHLRQLIFLGKVTALGVLCCFALFVCLTLLASFFLPSHLSFKNMYRHVVYDV